MQDRRLLAFTVAAALLAASTATAASLDKAKSLRSNGLLQEAKSELVDVLYDGGASESTKAEALLLLGEIAVDEKNFDAARRNWEQLIADHPATPFARSARDKLELLDQIAEGGEAAVTYAPGTVLVVGPSEYPWAALQIAGVLGPKATTLEGGSLADAIEAASRDSNVVGLVEVRLAVDVPFESGHVVCYRPSGEQVWKKTRRVTYPGRQEAIARRFVNKLSERVKGKSCP